MSLLAGGDLKLGPYQVEQPTGRPYDVGDNALPCGRNNAETFCMQPEAPPGLLFGQGALYLCQIYWTPANKDPRPETVRLYHVCDTLPFRLLGGSAHDLHSNVI